MTLVDILAIIAVLAGLILGWRRGMVAQLGSLLGIILGIVCCQVFAGPLAQAFSEPTDNPDTILMHTVISYLIIFALCYTVGRLLSGLLQRITDAAHLGAVDALAGSIFKGAEYLLALSMILNLWVAVFPNTRIDGPLATPVADFAPAILGSETAQEILSEGSRATDDLRDGLQDMLPDGDDANEASTDDPDTQG